jgi:hypothetical protein
LAAVAAFTRAGIDAGEAVVLVMRRERREPLFERLGWSRRVRDRLLELGQVTLLPARDTLAGLCIGGHPDAARMEASLGRLLGVLAPRSAAVRIYGEMTDLLWQDGRLDDALALEELWNGLIYRNRATLLCTYRLDAFDAAHHGGTLQRICRSHSHVLPATDVARFAAAVNAAVRELMPETQRERAEMMAVLRGSETAMPMAQRLLFWLRDVMPQTADKVLALAKEKYQSQGA